MKNLRLIPKMLLLAAAIMTANNFAYAEDPLKAQFSSPPDESKTQGLVALDQWKHYRKRDRERSLVDEAGGLGRCNHLRRPSPLPSTGEKASSVHVA